MSEATYLLSLKLPQLRLLAAILAGEPVRRGTTRDIDLLRLQVLEQIVLGASEEAARQSFVPASSSL